MEAPAPHHLSPEAPGTAPLGDGSCSPAPLSAAELTAIRQWAKFPLSEVSLHPHKYLAALSQLLAAYDTQATQLADLAAVLEVEPAQALAALISLVGRKVDLRHQLAAAEARAAQAAAEAARWKAEAKAHAARGAVLAAPAYFVQPQSHADGSQTYGPYGSACNGACGICDCQQAATQQPEAPQERAGEEGGQARG